MLVVYFPPVFDTKNGEDNDIAVIVTSEHCPIITNAISVPTCKSPRKRCCTNERIRKFAVFFYFENNTERNALV